MKKNIVYVYVITVFKRSEFVQSGKTRGKQETLSKVKGNQGNSDKIREFFSWSAKICIFQTRSMKLFKSYKFCLVFCTTFTLARHS